MNDRASWKICTAPMLDYSDRHWRFTMRQITRRARLYTEMIHARALLRGDAESFLRHDRIENPLALQLGGSDPSELAAAAKMAEAAGYDEVNLNCGCPSPKVKKGSFGACLMRTPQTVSGCLKAMRDAVSIAVTIKHRIGLDEDRDYAVLRDFVGEVSRSGDCRVFIVHARKAWLNGLSPKENRDIPPLRYDYVRRLKKDFPDLIIVINGGIVDNEAIAEHLKHVDGVMIGRAAYADPLSMRDRDGIFFGDEAPPFSLENCLRAWIAYARRELRDCPGLRLNRLAHPLLGLMHGEPGARTWRRLLSDPKFFAAGDPAAVMDAYEAARKNNE